MWYLAHTILHVLGTYFINIFIRKHHQTLRSDQVMYNQKFSKEGNVDSKFYNFVCTVTETFARIKREKVNSNNIAGKKSLIMIQKAPVNVLCRGQLSLRFYKNVRLELIINLLCKNRWRLIHVVSNVHSKTCLVCANTDILSDIAKFCEVPRKI